MGVHRFGGCLDLEQAMIITGFRHECEKRHENIELAVMPVAAIYYSLAFPPSPRKLPSPALGQGCAYCLIDGVGELTPRIGRRGGGPVASRTLAHLMSRRFFLEVPLGT